MSDQKLSITCPRCQNTFSIDEALTHQIQEQARITEKEKFQKQLEAVKKQTEEKSATEIKLMREENERKDRELEEARNKELEVRKEKNQLEDEKRAFELEKQRQLDIERQKIREQATTEVLEQQRLKEKEKDKIIDDLKKSLDEAQRKATQKSQQLQGEVQELDLETTLKDTFPEDFIEPVGKGELGADIRHVVKSPKGMVCGTILWESKRTKTWSDGWLMKLKTDLLADKANIPAIISEVVPDEAKSGIGLKNGVWITTPKLMLPLALLLRKALLDATYQKVVSEHRQTKSEMLYTYITSHEFFNQVKSMFETYDEMEQQIGKERAAYEKMWKQREMYVRRLRLGVAGIYGSIQGLAGSALPAIKNLELPEST